MTLIITHVTLIITHVTCRMCHMPVIRLLLTAHCSAARCSLLRYSLTPTKLLRSNMSMMSAANTSAPLRSAAAAPTLVGASMRNVPEPGGVGPAAWKPAGPCCCSMALAMEGVGEVGSGSETLDSKRSHSPSLSLSHKLSLAIPSSSPSPSSRAA